MTEIVVAIVVVLVATYAAAVVADRSADPAVPRRDSAPLRERFLRAFARGVSRLFFRRIEVVNADRIPAAAPVLLVANHPNGLVDPALILGWLPASPRFLAKSTFWKTPLLGHLVRLFGSIPVYRRQDAGVDTGRNRETFAAAATHLQGGGAIAIFPEGRSHAEPRIGEMKTGAARIAAVALESDPDLPLAIVPVGLTFDDRATFRSRAVIQVGEPIEPRLELRSGSEPETIRRLTARIGRGLDDVTVGYPSWEEARLIERAAELYSGDDARETLSEWLLLQRSFVDGYEELRRAAPERVGRVARAVRHYDRLLAITGLRDGDVVQGIRGRMPRILRSVAGLLLGAPLALAGMLLSYLPYRLAGLVANRFSQGVDVTATYKILSSLVLFPLTWTLEAVLVGRWLGVTAALAILVLAPLTAYIAMRFDERRFHLGTELRALIVQRTQPRLLRELRRRRRRVQRQVQELIDAYRGSEGHEEGRLRSQVN